MKSHALFLALALVLLGAGCSLFEAETSEAGTSGPVAFDVERSRYARGEQVEAEITNGSGAALYFSHCCGRLGFMVEQRRAGDWEAVRTVNLLCNALCDGAPISLEVGEAVTIPFRLDEPGWYRLALRYGEDRASVEAWETAYSRTFVVR